jgi:hypothetical protein
VSSTTSSLLGVWNGPGVVGSVAGSSQSVLARGVGGLGGALLGPEKSGGPCDPVFGWWVFAGFFVVVWLLDSGREHLCSCFAQDISPALFWVGWGVLFLLCLCVWRQAMKGVWWMPWHQEPMKDVGACDKPWGVGNRAVIRGCPNGETWLESCPVTCT